MILDKSGCLSIMWVYRDNLTKLMTITSFPPAEVYLTSLIKRKWIPGTTLIWMIGRKDTRLTDFPCNGHEDSFSLMKQAAVRLVIAFAQALTETRNVILTSIQPHERTNCRKSNVWWRQLGGVSRNQFQCGGVNINLLYQIACLLSSCL